MRVLPGRVAVAAALLLTTGCSSTVEQGDGRAPSSTTAHRSAAEFVVRADLGLVERALRAARKALPQAEFTEVNSGVDPQGDFVNLFVVVDAATERAVVYRGDALVDPPTPTPRRPGSVGFALTDVDPAVATRLDDILGAELPGGTLVGVSLQVPPGGATAPVWRTYLLGATGTPLEALVSLKGAILGVDTVS